MQSQAVESPIRTPDTQLGRKVALITGAGGSIGIHVVAHLMRHTDWDIVALDSFHHKGYPARIAKHINAHPEDKGRIKVFQHNLTCPISPELEQAMGKVDHLLHLAALSDVGLSIENPVWVVENNVRSTLQMLEYARRIKPETFVYFSTDEVLGPVTGDDAHAESDPHRPSNAYAASKAASEDICYCYWRGYDVPLIITRTLNNFGEMQSASKFPVIVQKKVEAGETVTIHGNEKELGTRFYIHSRNSADALLWILKKGARRHERGVIDEPHMYHIVGDDRLTNLDMAQKIAGLMGKELKYKIEDFHASNPAHDIHYGLQDNYMRPNGWKQPVSFEESMANTIKWQTENKEWIT